jgi:NADPH-dependent 7-cyano-7-deazaguanine reductase QueF
MANLKTQPNEARCACTQVTHTLSLPACCPVSQNPQPGSTLEIKYIPHLYLLEVQALRDYIDSYQGGRGDVRSMEGMIQAIAQDCANCIRMEVSVIAQLVLLPAQSMTVDCLARPRSAKSA